MNKFKKGRLFYCYRRTEVLFREKNIKGATYVRQE